VVVPRLNRFSRILAVANEKLDEITLKLMREVQQRLWLYQGLSKDYEKGKVISGLEKLRILLFSCRNKTRNDTVVTNGGRVC
jgi:phosphoribosylamine-glycine ligase